MSETIAAALSGGVDSTAALVKLLRGGHTRVFGVTALLLPENDGEHAADVAADVCRQLGVEHHVVDLRGEFERLVIEPFVADYTSGQTPNPCVLCNEHVKFGLILDKARELGADKIATGHYAQKRHTGAEEIHLLRASHVRKDQSYVLHRLSQQQLAGAMFVNGEDSRRENERIVAASAVTRLPARESQDVCFVTGGDHRRWLAEQVPGVLEPGPIVDTDGNVVGEHDGVIGYTVGQRRGIGISGKPTGTFVLYILYIDVENNKLVVGRDEELWVRWCRVEDVNLIGRTGGQCEAGTTTSFVCDAMLRYHGPLTPSRVVMAEGEALVRFGEPARAPTPGQSAVFYRGDRCLGGGVIRQSELTERFESQ